MHKIGLIVQLCDKSTKFGTMVDFGVLSNIRTGAKRTSAPGGRHLGFQDGRHSTGKDGFSLITLVILPT